MILASVVTFVGLGTLISWGSVQTVRHAPAFECVGGLLLVAGLMLLGAALPLAR